MRGVSSEAMVMCASSPENVEILDPPTGCVVGERVVCPGYDGMWYSTLPSITTLISCRLGGVLKESNLSNLSCQMFVSSRLNLNR